MRISRAALLGLTFVLAACSAYPAGVSAIPSTTHRSDAKTGGSGLLVIGENELLKLTLPGFSPQESVSGVADAILLPNGRIAASMSTKSQDSETEGWSISLLEPETLEPVERFQVGHLVDVIGPNPAPNLAASKNGAWLVGIRWPRGERLGHNVELWAVRLDLVQLQSGGIPLPGCGVGWPTPGPAPEQFTVICTNSGDVRLIDLEADGGTGDVSVLPLPPARQGQTDLNGNPLWLDRMLGFVAGPSGTVYITRGGGEIQQFDPKGEDITKVGDVAVGRYLPGIVALSSSGDVLYVGSGPLSDRQGSTGRRMADQLHAVDLTTGDELWRIDMPQPFTHLAVGPDDTLYATTFPHGDPPNPEPSLMRIDSAGRSAEIVIDRLSITPGPIVVIP